MIKLTNIKNTDTIKQLRGQINTMQNEIMANQPFVGALVNPSINYYSFNGVNATLVAKNQASTVKSSLTALCFPENNGVFVAGVWGTITITEVPQFIGQNKDYFFVVISVPAIKIATLGTNISTFVSCDSLGLPTYANIPGITTKPTQANIAGITFVKSDPGGIQVIPTIEQGDNICNIIFTESI